MIYLTGDIHSKNIKSWENENSKSQVLIAIKYLKILKKYNLSCTLFINGICLDKETQNVKQLLGYDLELGGHTYNNFGSMHIIKSYIYRKIFGCIYGPAFYQRKDIKKTKKLLRDLG